jgi:hypothetical protein
VPAGAIVAAHELTPSDLLQLSAQGVAGFCMAEGGATSHVAILARGKGLPCVVALGAAYSIKHKVSRWCWMPMAVASNWRPATRWPKCSGANRPSATPRCATARPGHLPAKPAMAYH